MDDALTLEGDRASAPTGGIGCVLASDFVDRADALDDDGDNDVSVSESLEGCRKALDGLVAASNMVAVVIMLSLTSSLFMVMVLVSALNPAAVCALLRPTA